MAQLMGPKEAEKLISRYGIRHVPQAAARTEREAVLASRKLGYPAVVKVISPNIPHKTEAGGVKTNLHSAEEVSQACKEIAKSAKKLRARVRGFLVQRQARGHEIIIGGKRDGQFGPVVLFGLGGIFVEIMRDVSMRVAPVSKSDAMEMIREIRGFPVLAGIRGGKPSDLDAIADAIVRVSRMMHENGKIKEMDINPAFADEKGCAAADVRVVLV